MVLAFTPGFSDGSFIDNDIGLGCKPPCCVVCSALPFSRRANFFCLMSLATQAGGRHAFMARCIMSLFACLQEFHR